MESKETKYCVYCGEKIFADAERCGHCGEWLDGSSISRNHISYTYTSRNTLDEEDEDLEPISDKKVKDTSVPIPDEKVKDNGEKNKDLEPIPDKKVEDDSVDSSNNVDNADKNVNKLFGKEYSNILPIRRLFLLMVLTFGLYSLYWVYKTNCYLRDDLGKDVSPGFRTFFMIIPIANIIVFYKTLNDMNKFIKKEGFETYSPGLNILIWLFVPFVGYWVYINVQESINEFWRIKEPNFPIKRGFSFSETFIMGLGAIIWILYYALIILLTVLGPVSVV